MAIFRVLEPAGYDRVLWQQYFNALPSRYRLIHFSPGYARTQALAKGDAALCAVAQDEVSGEFLMLPFILRDTAGVRSVESFYGYGGPVSTAYGARAMALAEELDASSRTGARSTASCASAPSSSPTSRTSSRRWSRGSASW
jgi:hypothetical protein